MRRVQDKHVRRRALQLYVLKCLLGTLICHRFYVWLPGHQLYWSIVSVLLVLAPEHRLVDEITDSVGAYVSGEVTLAVLNAAFTFILLSLLQMPFAPLMAFIALFVTLIPMIGSVLMWIIAGVFTLFTSWWAALIFAVVYFAYMQLEAYVITPRIMSKQVDVPGPLVLIGAMAGGLLLGLLGALVAVPVTASLLLILNRVTLPRQDAKLQPDL